MSAGPAWILAVGPRGDRWYRAPSGARTPYRVSAERFATAAEARRIRAGCTAWRLVRLARRPLPPLREARAAALARFEAWYLRRLWEAAGGSLSAAARLAGTTRGHLRGKLRRAGVGRYGSAGS